MPDLQITSCPDAPTLTVGFWGDNLAELRRRFNVRFTISSDPTADIDWFTLHDLRVSHESPAFSDEMFSCLDAVREQYLKFNDINCRRFYYVPGRESETYNGFMLTFFSLYRLLKSNHIALVLFSNTPHEGFDFVLYLTARFLKIRTVMCNQSSFQNRFGITETPEETGLFKCAPIIFEKENSHYTLPESWFYMRGGRRDSSYSFLDMLKEVLRRPYRLPPAMVRYAYAMQYRKNVAAQTLRHAPDEPYIYFPLHVQPELTTSALGGKYADQLLAIEVLSDWLPKGISILVKENPKQTEKQRGPLFYKRLAALPNVQLVASRENSIELIRGSLGVATVTGTAGWEALFYGKPVIIFGAAWYREFPGVHMFSSALDFDLFAATPAVEHAQLVDVLDQALQTAGKGVVDSAYAEMVPDFEPKENAKSVVESIVRYVNARSVSSRIEAI